MKDEFKVTFVVELAPKEVWEAITQRTHTDESGGLHYILPGFPSISSLDVIGASCTPIEVKEGHLLRTTKDDHPCQGTEVAVKLEQSGTGTAVTIVQSGFGAFLEAVGRDTVFSHGHQIVNDFRLYLERGLTVVGTQWGWNFGAKTTQTPIGVEIESLYPGEAFAERLGMQAGDLLLTLGGIRIHDHAQLWTVLALTDASKPVDATWARGHDAMEGSGAPA